MDTKDYGKKPHVVNVERLAGRNDNFRTTTWTGSYLQMTVMAILPGGDVGLEVHEDHDQFLRVEQGVARVVMGETQDSLSFEQDAEQGDAIFVPAGYWHNITNSGDEKLKVSSIYGPPEHATGTIHERYEDDPEHS